MKTCGANLVELATCPGTSSWGHMCKTEEATRTPSPSSLKSPPQEMVANTIRGRTLHGNRFGGTRSPLTILGSISVTPHTGEQSKQNVKT